MLTFVHLQKKTLNNAIENEEIANIYKLIPDEANQKMVEVEVKKRWWIGHAPKRPREKIARQSFKWNL